MEKIKFSKQIRLIEAVKRHQCIWNLNHVDFGHRFQVKQAWKAVLKELDPSWAHKTATKQEAQLKETQKQWSGIRNHYRKSQKTGKIENLLKETSSSYCKSLTFLDEDPQPEIMKSKEVTSEPNKDDLEVEAEESLEEEEEPVMKFETVEIHLDPEPIAANHYTSIKKENDRSNKDFLQSLLPDVDTMTEDELFEFKVSVLNIIHNIKNKKHNDTK